MKNIHLEPNRPRFRLLPHVPPFRSPPLSLHPSPSHSVRSLPLSLSLSLPPSLYATIGWATAAATLRQVPRPSPISSPAKSAHQVPLLDPPLMQTARRLASWSLQRRLLLPSQVQAPSIPNAAAAAAFLHSHATSFGTHCSCPLFPLI